ncbi:GNAT family N-acetyltransferase [Glutamicibacter halophytocola]|uniref:GNAT family N-acetyltransferase n=1 Tax=Glutamicibacter halophytocola TaxID=1933880 RepID=A0ABX5YDH2_9MICC|nr:GNAT family N-acetyltransferase [Glutamicibacter halophytocola]QDY67691.1 GNAT family N-acetyltransferase [Glutamicibacter halophytocola]
MNELEFRDWRSGDDLELLQVFGDPRSPQAHQDRTMLRENSDAPFSRTLVASVDGVAIGAGVVFASSLHPQRLWLYVEVAAEQRRSGVGTALVAKLRQQIPADQVQQLKARYTVTPGDPAAAAAGFCKALGLGEIQVSRDVILEPGALAEPVFDTNDRVIEELSTGSVELTKLVMDFYNKVHEQWDPAKMTVGSAQRMLLDEHTGAQAALVLRDKPKSQGGVPLAFAVSYVPAREDAPSDVLVGHNPAFSDDEVAEAVRDMVAMLIHQYPVKLEVDSSMFILASLIDALAGVEQATVISTTHILASDAAK